MTTKKSTKLDSIERVQVEARAEWRRWLKKNHTTAPGAWAVTYKKNSGKPSVSYADIVEEALCFGWIDSKPSKLDDERTMLLFTPRRPKSAWSKLNKERVARLTAAGLMEPAGLAMVELAQATGTWDALNHADALVVPPDLAERLAALPPAREHFDAFPKSVKRAILEWIGNAKRPETRRNRIEETATRASKNERANQWPR